MAKIEKKNVRINNLLDEFERKIFLLKIQYEKYFSGFERIEPMKEREDLRRDLRNLTQEPITNTMQKHKFTSLRARFNSLDLYLTRNLVQIERGTHPKMKFRTAMRDAQKRDAERMREDRAARRREFSERQKQDLAYRRVFDQFIAVRKKCGQSTDISFEAMKKSLSKQSRMVKSKFKSDKVKFRVFIEGGKAKMKAVVNRGDD